MTEILKDKYLNLTETNRLMYAGATVITEDVSATACYKSETHGPETTSWVTRLQENVNGVRKDLTAFAELKEAR